MFSSKELRVATCRPRPLTQKNQHDAQAVPNREERPRARKAALPPAPERSKATLPTNPVRASRFGTPEGVQRRTPRASRLSARKAAQPHARKFVDLSDFGTIRSRSAIEEQTYKG
jgi:hypothetical protein